MSAEKTLPTPPKHLRAATRRWWSEIVAEYALEPHHLRLLTLAGEAWDRAQQARGALARHGLTYTDRHKAPRPRPEVSIERDSRIAFARMVRELGLDRAPAGESRPGAIPANHHLRVS
jgi:P27 family predicted phage terminase small subunit